MSRISFGLIEAGYIPGDLGAFKKEAGKVRLYDGGSAQPSSQTVSQLTYGPEMQPVAKELMKRGMALASQPYEKYEYDRIAGFDPMQLQAQQAAANMRVSPYLGQSAGIASSVAQRAGQISQYDPTRFQEERVSTGQFNQPGVAGTYMSPYMQNVVDIAKREAQRQADIGETQRGAQAVGAGAFGGSRQAIVEAEANRNLMQQMGDIQTKGSQAAYEQAAAQFQQDQARRLQAAMANQAKNLEAQQLSEQSRQYGADLGLRGLQAQLSAAQQLGGLGQAQFGQAKDIVGMQGAAGAERQAQLQRKYTQDYQDFLNQKQFPYLQAQFAQEMLRGMPMTSIEKMYKSDPDASAQIMGLYSMYQGGKKAGYFANGGLTDLALYNMTR